MYLQVSLQVSTFSAHSFAAVPTPPSSDNPTTVNPLPVNPSAASARRGVSPEAHRCSGLAPRRAARRAPAATAWTKSVHQGLVREGNFTLHFILTGAIFGPVLLYSLMCGLTSPGAAQGRGFDGDALLMPAKLVRLVSSTSPRSRTPLAWVSGAVLSTSQPR